MPNILFLLNDPPYGTERTYNALRLALELSKQEDVSIRIFAQADAVTSALKDQKTPNGYYNIERMLKRLLADGAQVRL